MSKKILNAARRVVLTAAAAAITLTGAGCRQPAQKSESGPESWQADAAALEEANRTANKNELLIGCWIPPHPHQTKTPETAEARMAELAA